MPTLWDMLITNTSDAEYSTSANDLDDQAVNDRVCDCDSENLTHEMQPRVPSWVLHGRLSVLLCERLFNEHG